MKHIAIFGLFFIFLSISVKADCLITTDENLCVRLEWIDGPYVGGYSSNIVKFVDLSESTNEVIVYKSPTQKVEFFGWMLMHGHGHGTRPVETIEEAQGIYRNNKIFYMGGMSGSWLFKMKIGEKEYVLNSFKVE